MSFPSARARLWRAKAVKWVKCPLCGMPPEALCRVARGESKGVEYFSYVHADRMAPFAEEFSFGLSAGIEIGKNAEEEEEIK